MTNEAVLEYETELPIQFTVADGTGITKGAVLKLTDPITAIISSGSNDAVAGIAATDKIASDGVTKLAVYRNGVFKMFLSGSCTVGDALVIEGVSNLNYVKTAPNLFSLSGSNILGIALETGATGESIYVELSPQTVRHN